jgi:hypothetical protein
LPVGRCTTGLESQYCHFCHMVRGSFRVTNTAVPLLICCALAVPTAVSTVLWRNGWFVACCVSQAVCAVALLGKCHACRNTSGAAWVIVGSQSCVCLRTMQHMSYQYVPRVVLSILLFMLKVPSFTYMRLLHGRSVSQQCTDYNTPRLLAHLHEQHNQASTFACIAQHNCEAAFA